MVRKTELTPTQLQVYDHLQEWPLRQRLLHHQRNEEAGEQQILQPWEAALMGVMRSHQDLLLDCKPSSGSTPAVEQEYRRMYALHCLDHVLR